MPSLSVTVILLLSTPDSIWEKEQLRHHKRDDYDQSNQPVSYV
jgi:hypothetical protein